MLAPLNDIAPEIVHPALGVSVRELYERLLDGEKCKVRAVEEGVGTGFLEFYASERFVQELGNLFSRCC